MIISLTIIKEKHLQQTVFYDIKNILLINPLPDDKILDWSKSKQIADNILKCIYGPNRNKLQTIF